MVYNNRKTTNVVVTIVVGGGRCNLISPGVYQWVVGVPEVGGPAREMVVSHTYLGLISNEFLFTLFAPKTRFVAAFTFMIKVKHLDFHTVVSQPLITD